MNRPSLSESPLNGLPLGEVAAIAVAVVVVSIIAVLALAHLIGSLANRIPTRKKNTRS